MTIRSCMNCPWCEITYRPTWDRKQIRCTYGLGRDIACIKKRSNSVTTPEWCPVEKGERDEW